MTARNAKPQPPAEKATAELGESFPPKPIDLDSLTSDELHKRRRVLLAYCQLIDTELAARPIDPTAGF